jgi:hypothetical protein
VCESLAGNKALCDGPNPNLPLSRSVVAADNGQVRVGSVAQSASGDVRERFYMPPSSDCVMGWTAVCVCLVRVSCGTPVASHVCA